jgi:hypothetical protein
MKNLFQFELLFHEILANFFRTIAGLFGYPTNPGMPTTVDLPPNIAAQMGFVEELPKHRTLWPPIQKPETWFEMVFGPAPKLDIVPRYIYESTDEGFYNFYIENYQNIYFLPDWLSEFIQVKLHLCLDITVLETIREVFFVGLMVYSQIVILRIALAWFIYINPYTFPWCYLTAAVDWTEDVLQGFLPSILGVNLTGSVFLGIIGVVADSLNHLVFTMPFLPSEGEPTKLLINQQMKDVLVFHYLPILWYRYPIPNEIREFWYQERPDILNYMEKAYKDLDIQFLPDNIVTQKLTAQGFSISTEIVSQNNLIQASDLWNFGNEGLRNFIFPHIEKLI